jgi:hypothetical protein
MVFIDSRGSGYQKTMVFINPSETIKTMVLIDPEGSGVSQNYGFLSILQKRRVPSRCIGLTLQCILVG